MIIEIALAIVLAVIILANLEAILGLGILALILGLIVAAVIGIGYFIQDNYGSEINHVVEEITHFVKPAGSFFAIALLLFIISGYFVEPYKEIKLIGLSQYFKKNKPSIITLVMLLIFITIISTLHL